MTASTDELPQAPKSVMESWVTRLQAVAIVVRIHTLVRIIVTLTSMTIDGPIGSS